MYSFLAMPFRTIALILSLLKKEEMVGLKSHLHEQGREVDALKEVQEAIQE